MRVRQALAELAVEAERWEEACQLAADHPDLAQTVCLPWAEWLVARGSFQEARLAYRYCSLPKLGLLLSLICFVRYIGIL